VPPVPLADLPQPVASFLPQPGLLPEVPAVPESPFAPHIELDSSGSSFDWGRALLFLLLAIVAGVTGFFLLPLLLR
jgi:hypothetical protein